LHFFKEISIFNALDVVLGEIFLLPPQQHVNLFKICNQFYSRSRHWLVIKCEYCFH